MELLKLKDFVIYFQEYFSALKKVGINNSDDIIYKYQKLFACYLYLSYFKETFFGFKSFVVIYIDLFSEEFITYRIGNKIIDIKKTLIKPSFTNVFLSRQKKRYTKLEKELSFLCKKNDNNVSEKANNVVVSHNNNVNEKKNNVFVPQNNNVSNVNEKGIDDGVSATEEEREKERQRLLEKSLFGDSEDVYSESKLRHLRIGESTYFHNYCRIHGIDPMTLKKIEKP